MTEVTSQCCCGKCLVYVYLISLINLFIFRNFQHLLLVCFCVCPITQQMSFKNLQSSTDDAIDGQEDCIVDYLKRKGFVDLDFIYHEFNGNRYSCDFKIKKKIDAIYAKLARGFKKDDDLKNHTECLIRNLKFVNMAEMTLEMKVQDSIKTVSMKDVSNFVPNYEESLDTKKEDAILSCKVEMKLNKLFNETMLTKFIKLYRDEKEFLELHICNETANVYAMDEFKERYCTRMYVVDNKLIDPEFYHVKIHEDCVHRFERDCDNILSERNKVIVEDMLESLIKPYDQPRKRICMKKRIKFGNYFDYFAVIKVLNDRYNTDDEIDQQRQHFITNINAILEKVMKC